MNSTPLVWYGAGKEATAFALETELDVFVSPHEKERDRAAAIFPDARGRYDLCRIGLEGLKGRLPRRIPSNHLVFQGRRVVMESIRNGKELRIHIPPDHPLLQECLGMFKVLLSRGFNPQKGILVEKINGVSAGRSEFRDALREFGFISGLSGLELQKRY